MPCSAARGLDRYLMGLSALFPPSRPEGVKLITLLANSPITYRLYLLTRHKRSSKIRDMQERDTKQLVLTVFKKAYSNDLSIAEASKRAGVAANTASTWIKVLTAEGILEESRRVGNAKMYRLRRR